MKYDKYVSLIRELENYARSNRKSYEFRVFGLAALGYAYFLGIIALFLVIPVLIIILLVAGPSGIGSILWLAVKLWWIFLPGLGLYIGFVGGAVKSLFAKFPEPSGTEITETDAPEFFSFIRSASKSLHAKFPERVLLTDEFNAAIVTTPRLGMFGRRVYLLVGLPLMSALSPEQFKAVVAHEIGHISGRHGGFAKWAYQLREAWGRFIDSQELNDHKLAYFYSKFVNWFFPYFTAYSFVLMREHEKEADAYAVELVGAQPLGESLIALETRNSELNNVFWKRVHEENLSSDKPEGKIFSRMLEALAFFDAGRDTESISKAVSVPTDYEDSHPSLSERLRLIGYWTDGDLPRMPEHVSKNAADHFLGGLVKRYTEDVDSAWDEQLAADWRLRHEHFRDRQKRLDDLNAKGEDALSPEELLEFAGIIAEKEGSDAALPIVERIVERHPSHAESVYTLGALLLPTDSIRGLSLLDRAMELDPARRMAASDAAFNFLRSRGRFDEAMLYADSLEKESELIEKGRQERSHLNANDKFEPHTLSEETVAEIVKKLDYFEEIRTLYLVRKVVQYRPDIPFHVLFIDLRPPKRFRNTDLNGDEILKIAVERLDNGQIDYFMVLGNSGLGADLDSIPGAKILSRQ